MTATHLSTGKDFFSTEPPACDYIISNPPYSLKGEVLERLFDLDKPFAVDPEQFQSMGRATPFAGMELYGVCKMTMVDGEIVWRENE